MCQERKWRQSPKSTLSAELRRSIACGADKQAQRGTMFSNARAVASSAGKNDSIASSDTVTSTGVPNTVVVLKNDSLPAGVTSCNGITTPPNLSGAAGARLIGVG